MKTRSPEEIRKFLHDSVESWNAGRKEEMFAVYRAMVPGRMTIEYIGIPPLEGWAALEDMWQRFAGKVRIEPKEVMVTGNEAACYHLNTTLGAGTPPRPSIELYRFDGDDVAIRYFHQAQI
ncbi:hypothetical protein [Pelomonas sp. KK5]|uniref:hypothetical protein n=1 Tax=Pelomonas sp. KK5 TaxID=1855730 RepID=UPI00097C67AF|nr:hypothetical protein [Pelomonas sp. KK5]